MNMISILLIEDNPADVGLIRQALEESPVPTQLYAVPDTSHALTFLQGNEYYLHTGRPALIIVDLNLPEASEYDFLQELRHYPTLVDIPVVILTSSARQEDRRLGQPRQAVEYIEKPIDIEEYLARVQEIVISWGLHPPGTATTKPANKVSPA